MVAISSIEETCEMIFAYYGAVYLCTQKEIQYSVEQIIAQ